MAEIPDLPQRIAGLEPDRIGYSIVGELPARARCPAIAVCEL